MATRFLTYPRVVLLAIGVAALLRAPAVLVDYFSDDYLHLQVLEGIEPSSTAARSRLDLYRFFTGDVEDSARRMAVGSLPWRFDTEQKTAHFRPLASALMWLDHSLFGLDALGPHLHSLIWFLGLIAAAGALYARILPGPQLALAVLLVSLSPLSLFPVLWWSARNMLVATVLGLLGLVAHLRWREDGWRPGLPLSIAAFCLALLGGECGVQCLAYVFAYSLWGDPGNRRARLGALIPSALILGGYLLARSQLGYGVARSRFYIDPVSAPYDYAANLLPMLPLAVGQLLQPYGRLLDPFRDPPIAAAGIVLGIAIFAWLLRRALAAAPNVHAKTFCWLLGGCLLSLLPCFTARGSPRAWTLVVPGLGTTAALAVVMHFGWSVALGRQRVTLSIRLLTAALCAFLAAVNLAAPVLTVPMRARNIATRAHELEILPAPSHISAEVEDIVVVRADTWLQPALFSMYGPRVDVHAVWTLSDTLGRSGRCTLTRTAPDTFILSVAKGALTPHNDFYRSEQYPLRRGKIELDGLQITVMEMEGALVKRAQFRFSRSLDDPSYALLAQSDVKLRPISLPPVGRSMVLP